MNGAINGDVTSRISGEHRQSRSFALPRAFVLEDGTDELGHGVEYFDGSCALMGLQGHVRWHAFYRSGVELLAAVPGKVAIKYVDD